MYFQPCEIENTDDKIRSAGALKSSRRKLKKRTVQYNERKQILKREKQRFANSMSSWAESFSRATSWQLKQQMAQWRAKARTLEYENNILRAKLRQYAKGKVTEIVDITVNASSEDDTELNSSNDEDERMGEDKLQLELRKQYVCKKNSEFRRKRQESEIKQQFENEAFMTIHEKCLEAEERVGNKTVEYQELYGSHWQRIATLETTLDSQFIDNCSIAEPITWPVIALRL